MVYYLWKAYNLQIRQFMFFMFPPRYKKSVETYQLLAPPLEALGLPITVETSNHDPTPICIELITIYMRLKIRANV